MGGDHRSPKRGAARDAPAGRINPRRCAGEALATFEPDEIRKGDEHAMLFGDTADDALPAHDRGRERLAPPLTVLRLAQPARRRRARHDDQLRALEGGDGRGQRVPGVLANQDRGLPTPTRLERPYDFLPTIA